MRLVRISPEEIMRAKPTAPQIRSRKRTPTFAVFENIRSLYNVGAMFRSSDAALVSKVYLTGYTGKPPHKDIDKCALGATDVVPWQYCRDSRQAILELKSKGVSIVGLELTRQSIPYSKIVFQFPVCLVVGNEIDGISQYALDLCDAAIDIPMLGRANSLNVATAYGIALFEILKQYCEKHA